MKICKAILLVPVLLALSCGPKKAQQPLTRDFPKAEIPMMVAEPSERILWLSVHFWDKFTDTLTLYHCDSLTVNGVKSDDLEKQMGVFSSLLAEIPLEEGSKDMLRFMDRLEAFQKAHPESNMLQKMAEVTAKYFYDPNSPVRSEDLYLPFVSRLASSSLIDPIYRMGYNWDEKMCRMNRTGTPAADFTFIDTNGKSRTLYGIKADYTLLIFGNPDCHACKELVENISFLDDIRSLMDSGRLKVADIYIDEDIALWKEKMREYPQDWINGYDPTFTIRTDVLYNVRALPSMYLLDKDKTVLLKDAVPDAVLDYLLNL